jgi:hypothetical protein
MVVSRKHVCMLVDRGDGEHARYLVRGFLYCLLYQKKKKKKKLQSCMSTRLLGEGKPKEGTRSNGMGPCFDPRARAGNNHGKQGPHLAQDGRHLPHPP